MANPFTVARRRAREELAQLHQHLSERLDALESTPAEGPSELGIKAAMAPTINGVKGRCDVLTKANVEMAKAFEALEEKVKTFTFAVVEGIERVDRAERRIHATVKRARKELAEHGFESPGLEAEAHELRLVDGDGGPDGTVPQLPAEVGLPAEEASSIRGVPATALRRVRGF